MSIPSNPPAFPRTGFESHDYNVPSQTGMSLRDYFAAAALTGLVSNPLNSKTPGEELVQVAFMLADDMLERRTRKGGAE